MTTPVTAFIAMFDILGFKELRKQKGTAGLHNLYKKALLPQIEHSAALKRQTIIEEDGQFVCVPDFGTHSLAYQIVSDSILLFTADDSFDSFLKIFSASHSLLCFGFAGTHCPLRGAIGHGDLILDPESIYIGSAIEDAYQGEESQCWSGCMLTEACEFYCRERSFFEKHEELLKSRLDIETDSGIRNALLSAATRLISYAIPIKSRNEDGCTTYSTRQGLAVNWTTNVHVDVLKKSFNEASNAHCLRIQKNTKEFEHGREAGTAQSPKRKQIWRWII
jgi:hypothetical protein